MKAGAGALPTGLATALRSVAALPPDRPGPVFREPWHAKAWALAIALHGQGHFTWGEWAARLAAALAEAPAGSDPEADYYLAWLTALERLASDRGLVDEARRRALSGADAVDERRENRG